MRSLYKFWNCCILENLHENENFRSFDNIFYKLPTAQGCYKFDRPGGLSPKRTVQTAESERFKQQKVNSLFKRGRSWAKLNVDLHQIGRSIVKSLSKQSKCVIVNGPLISKRECGRSGWTVVISGSFTFANRPLPSLWVDQFHTPTSTIRRLDRPV